MNELAQTGLGWTVVLRRQPSRTVAGRAEGGHTDAYELVCCGCGDHPDTDYREVSSKLQQIRGPYTIAAASRRMSGTSCGTTACGRALAAARRDCGAHPPR